MINNNIILMEAMDNTFDPQPFISELKKIMNTCKLTKYQSIPNCNQFYNAFFLCRNSADEPLTFDNWRAIYTGLLNEDAFCNNLCLFISMYSNNTYTGMFSPLIRCIDSELPPLQNKIRYISEAKSFFTFFQTKMESIKNTIVAQVNDVKAITFITTIINVLQMDIFYLNKLLQREVEKANNNIEPTMATMPIHNIELSEEAKSIIEAFQDPYRTLRNIGIDYNEDLNENIIKKGVENAKLAKNKQDKAKQAFNDYIMKKVKKARENRRNRKHAEMVGEALHINYELKKILRSLPVFLFNPALGVITWVVQTVYDRATDKKDRDELVTQLKNEIEIIDEKISQAERNGDDKGKIELMRLKQRMVTEYNKVNRMRFDGSRLINNAR